MKTKVAIVVTSQDEYTGHGRPTGLWLSELVHFTDVMESDAISYDLVSPRGGEVPIEPKSLQGMTYDRATREKHQTPSYMEQLTRTLAADEVDASDYDAIYYTGGHGVMYDFLEDEHLARLTREIFEDGGVVAAVCHGYCGLLNVSLSDDSYLIANKTVTGFSWLEERLSGVADKVPYNAEALAKERSANYRKALLPFVPFVMVDGRLVTGQNPGSATRTARKTLEVLRRVRDRGIGFSKAGS